VRLLPVRKPTRQRCPQQARSWSALEFRSADQALAWAAGGR